METNRINWIDWAKTVAITMVVFGHIPEARGSFLVSFICSFHMPFFFFLSGFLFKVRKNYKEEFHKIKRSLIIPYFIYNLIFYPYWLLKYYISHNGICSFYEIIIKPTVGTFCLQIETPYTSPLNGVTWFLAVLLIIKITLIVFHRKMKVTILIGLIIIIANILNNYFHFARSLTVVGFLENTPFYILGYLTKKYEINIKKSINNLTVGIFFICISIIIYLNRQYIPENMCNILITYYVLCIFAIYGMSHLCKSLNNFSSKIVRNISIGTLMIMGVHWMFIGTTNKILEYVYNLEDGILYSWYESLILAIIIEICIYPFIIYAINNNKILLGK